ncbi:hypothetical protein [Nocardia mikamii]|uniref:hypothetical protein n=1 Tax=Nocardia mikamii TaxID=508464 RepID=UPI0007A423D6|nr:hypothetical protein [Nocardia mikamii]
MHQIVRRLGGGGHLLSASADVADNDADPQHAGAGYLDHGDLTIGELGMRAVDTLRADDLAAIDEIRSRIPRTDTAIVEWLRRRAAELEASAPQVGEIEAFNSDYRVGPPRCER